MFIVYCSIVHFVNVYYIRRVLKDNLSSHYYSVYVVQTVLSCTFEAHLLEYKD